MCYLLCLHWNYINLIFLIQQPFKCSWERCKKKGKVVPLRSIEAHVGDRRYSSCSFLTWALERGESSASRPGRVLPPGKEPPGTHCAGGWVGPRADLDADVRGKILCLCRGSNPGRPVRSQTLYWLSYPGSAWERCNVTNFDKYQ
jgi:hypothetical protein